MDVNSSGSDAQPTEICANGGPEVGSRLLGPVGPSFMPTYVTALHLLHQPEFPPEAIQQTSILPRLKAPGRRLPSSLSDSLPGSGTSLRVKAKQSFVSLTEGMREEARCQPREGECRL